MAIRHQYYNLNSVGHHGISMYTYTGIPWRLEALPPETMQKRIRAPFKMRLPLQRECMLAMDLIFVWSPPTPPTHETMPKLIRAPFQMWLQLKQDYILATYIMLVWRPPPETMQKWIRATFQMWLPLQREFIWATDNVLVWRHPPRKRCQNGSGHILKCGSRWSGTLFWPPERDECACLRVCMYV